MTSDGQLDVRFFAPPADLAPCFTTFYRLELKLPPRRRLHDQLQPEWANLRFFSGQLPVSQAPGAPPLRDARVTATGPSSHPVAFSLGTTRMWGIGLHPLGWSRYVGVPASDLADTIVDGERSPVFRPLSALAGQLCRPDGEDAAQFAAIVDFFRSIGRQSPDEGKIAAIHAALIEPNTVAVHHIAEATGMKMRTLERACSRYFGFSPNILLRRQRLMRSLAAYMLSGGSTWSDAIDGHYHDQAHFVHEFQYFMGMSPTEYARQPHPILSAFMAERQRVWGSPVQTLDRPGTAHGPEGVGNAAQGPVERIPFRNVGE